MNENDLRSSRHLGIRSLLRVVGPVLAGVGLFLEAVGMWSFFASFGSFGPPRFFWCAFVGGPVFMVGIIATMFGYLGALNRYVAAEAAPVTKDVVNYMGEGTQPGVRATAKALADGVLDSIQEHKQES